MIVEFDNGKVVDTGSVTVKGDALSLEIVMLEDGNLAIRSSVPIVVQPVNFLGVNIKKAD